MQLPFALKDEIEKQIKNVSLNALKKRSDDLSALYREGIKGGAGLGSDLERLAYVSVRMPATYATIVQVFKELRKRASTSEIGSMLDIGAGPGTGLWAAVECFGLSLQKMTLIEKDPSFARLGKELARARSWEGADLCWEVADAAQIQEFSSHDLVLASFSLGEMKENDWKRTVLTMWKASKKYLVIVEPGTPKGFERIKEMRKILLEQGAHLIAPCPHSQICPMQGSDWCHFGARVERSSLHRQIKSGTMNYEDEKFCYLVFSRESCLPVRSRVLSRPQKNDGYVNLKLCSEQGIRSATVSRKSKEDYRRARKLEWGDGF